MARWSGLPLHQGNKLSETIQFSIIPKQEHDHARHFSAQYYEPVQPRLYTSSSNTQSTRQKPKEA